MIDAAGRGAIEGLHLSLNVAGMLIAFIALVALVNGMFGYVHGLLVVGGSRPAWTSLLGWIFRPIAWAMGVSWKDSLTVGNLLGTRMVLNEFVAFAKLGEPGVGSSLDPRSFVIVTYALCGFANFSSIAIQIGGIGSLAPSRRGDLARLGTARDDRRDAGELSDGDDRGDVVVGAGVGSRLRGYEGAGRSVVESLRLRLSFPPLRRP